MSLKTQLKKLHNSITWMEYDPRVNKLVRKIRPEVGDAFVWSLLLFVIVLGATTYLINPNPKSPTPSRPLPEIRRGGTGYEELLLSFHSEEESRECLQWLNETSQSRLWQALSEERINSSRIEIIVTRRPYKTWTQVYYLPKVGVKTMEQIITAWRSQFDQSWRTK